MPISNLVTLASLLLAAALLYRFRERILGALRRFEANNRARRAEEMRARFDKYAHYRQTVGFAEEQIEEVTKITVSDPRTGMKVERFLFLGIEYPTRADAEAVRRAEIVAKAREFYIDLDRTFLARRRRPDTINDPPAGGNGSPPPG
jgi:hypothetical protein